MRGVDFMEYTIKRLARMAGISSRTLRYYDELGILKPARINSSGYRIYGQKEIDLLQQILFYKELDFDLKAIKNIITAPSFNIIEALKSHRNELLKKRKKIDVLLVNVDKTLESHEGRIKMTTKEKFTGFKQQMIEENEKTYGKEIREKYGDDEVNQANKNLNNMTKEEYDKLQKLTEELYSTLNLAVKTNNPASE